MKKGILGLSVFCLVFFFGCTKGCSTPNVGCALEQVVVDQVSPVVATQLQCSNVAAIKADLTQAVAGLNLCAQAQAGKPKLPAPICSMLGDLIVNGVAKVVIPASWGCSAANAKDLLRGVIIQGCSSI